MMRTPHILVGEADREIRTMVSRFLQKQGYRVTQSEDARSMDKALGTATIDLILLDIMLPGGEDGLSIGRRHDGARSRPRDGRRRLHRKAFRSAGTCRAHQGGVAPSRGAARSPGAADGADVFRRLAHRSGAA